MATPFSLVVLFFFVEHISCTLVVKDRSFSDVQTALDFIVEEGNKELKQRVQILEKEVSALKKQLEEGNKELQRQVYHLENEVAELENKNVLTRPRRSVSNKVAFSVYPSGHLTGLGTNQQLVFNTINYISGGGYNINTGVYTCPVSGMYYLRLSVLSNIQGAFYGEIVVAGSRVGIAYTGKSSDYGYGAHANIAHCSKGQTIFLRRLGSHGTGSLHAGKYTNFVGFLLWTDT